MNKDLLIKSSFFIYMVGLFGGAWLKITHHTGDILLFAGMLFMVVFVVAAILEVQRSTRIGQHQKMVWTVGFILSGAIAGLVYMALVRKRIVAATTA